jgi:hypothetical protein
VLGSPHKASASDPQASRRDALHEKARQALESGEKIFSERAREAAKYLAEARKLGARQRDSAKAIGKSVSWVNVLLKWHDGGYKADCPFPRAARLRVQPAKQKNKSSRPPTTAEAAAAQAAKANAERAKAEAQKAKAEASKARAEASKARTQARERIHEAFFGYRREKKKIHSGARDILIKALGMLGSEHAGERDNAARVVEKQRARLGMTWEELIVPAEADVRAKAA